MIDYLRLQIGAGAQAVQIFDSWAGLLATDGLRALRAAAGCGRSSTACADLGVPVIYFVNGGPHLLGPGGQRRRRRARAVLAHCRSTSPRRIVGPDVALQGNLDPHVLFADPPRSRRQADDVLAARGRAARPHHEPRPRHPARHADRERRGAGRGRPRHRAQRADAAPCPP